MHAGLASAVRAGNVSLLMRTAEQRPKLFFIFVFQNQRVLKRPEELPVLQMLQASSNCSRWEAEGRGCYKMPAGE